ncbi:MAG: twin-arginine translocation pathway signal protein, partial [Planctomycetota bacterium]|nr:twin-arginine translocation pathway signal protein [Planctomycetota bacterium]
AVANPTPERATGDALTTRAAGFGVVRIHKLARSTSFECWPRNVDVSDPSARPYPGWPKTVHQLENDGREPVAWLPEISVKGRSNCVLQVLREETGELVYAIRMDGTRFRPKVYVQGSYTLHVDERVITGVQAGAQGRALSVEF